MESRELAGDRMIILPDSAEKFSFAAPGWKQEILVDYLTFDPNGYVILNGRRFKKDGTLGAWRSWFFYMSWAELPTLPEYVWSELIRLQSVEILGE